MLLPCSVNVTRDKVHGRGTDETSNEHVNREVVQLFRRSCLLNDTIFHNNDTITHCHSFDLVMRYVDCCFQDVSSSLVISARI